MTYRCRVKLTEQQESFSSTWFRNCDQKSRTELEEVLEAFRELLEELKVSQARREKVHIPDETQRLEGQFQLHPLEVPVGGRAG